MKTDFIIGIYGDNSTDIEKLVETSYSGCKVKKIKKLEDFSKYELLEYPDIIFLHNTELTTELINTIRLTDKGIGSAIFCLISKTNDSYIYFDTNLVYRDSYSEFIELNKDTIVEIIGKMIRKNKIQLSVTDANTEIKDLKVYIDMINLWDSYTKGHCLRTQRYATFIMKKLNLSLSEKKNISSAALLHDIGKIAVKKRILQKTDKLSNKEFEIVKNHSLLASRYLPGKQFNSIREMIVSHHERYDGTGYPHNLSGKEIPLGSYIIGIADAFDAMTSARGYNKVKTLEEAKQELLQYSGKQFHPELVNIFIDIIDNSSRFQKYFNSQQKNVQPDEILTYKKTIR